MTHVMSHNVTTRLPPASACDTLNTLLKSHLRVRPFKYALFLWPLQVLSESIHQLFFSLHPSEMVSGFCI